MACDLLSDSLCLTNVVNDTHTHTDIIERFQISVFLLIIVVHNASDSTWNFTLSWASEILGACVLVFASEILVDWIKHGFVSKFNNFSFRVYDKFLRILRADLVVFDPYVTMAREKPRERGGTDWHFDS